MSSTPTQVAPLNRLEAIRQTIGNKTEEIKHTKIFGIWGTEFPLLVDELFEAIELDIDQNILPLPPTSRIIAIENINQQLEDLLSLFESIISTTCKNSAVHEFISYVLRDLGLSKQTRYLICMGNSLATLPIIEALQDIFYGSAFYENLNNYLELAKKDYTDFSIMFIPPVILQKKTFWAALVHELGHIIINRYNLVGQFNPKVELQQAGEVHTDNERNYYHGCEYACDFIASAYFGPVYYESLYEYIYVNNVFLAGTHPTWDARLFFLQEILTTTNASKNRVATTPSQNYRNIANIDKIISLTKQKVFDTTQKYYQNNDRETKKVKDNLKNKVPYIGTPRFLLNSYWENQTEILEEIKKEDSESKAILENRIAPIIEDSIRITNMERTFRLMANG